MAFLLIILNKNYMQKTLGGDRIGSGKKMKVNMHGYDRSTHDMGYLWRSTMSAGTLVPFLCEVALPGDTFDIDLEAIVKTHPTIGPLFGGYKLQLDVFQAPIRLYQGQLHNNKLGIGMNMSQIYLPVNLFKAPNTEITTIADPDNMQINPSCIHAYLGLRGIGVNKSEEDFQSRYLNAVPYLAYWDIYKNYYANKQEDIGYVIHCEEIPETQNVTSITVDSDNIPQAPLIDLTIIGIGRFKIIIAATPGIADAREIILNTNRGKFILSDIITEVQPGPGLDENTYVYDWARWGTMVVTNWEYRTAGTLNNGPVRLEAFALSNIDEMRENILAWATNPAAFVISDASPAPYGLSLIATENFLPLLGSQEGLGIKTYQSDLFNNWLRTEWIDGPSGVAAVTAIDTTSGSFTIDTLNLSKKVYDMLNRIAVSGGSYDDWLDAVYTHDRYIRAESPIYHGGLIREVVFQEVVSTAESTTTNGDQPLGTLAGKGVMGNKKKGGKIVIKVDEPSYIMGIVSLTPRIDYSQGNKWDTQLQTLDDLHKPALDEIGFQDLQTEQMAWWATYNEDGGWVQTSAGKQPAWISYMSNVNRTYGNFAIESNEMFMTLNRRYSYDFANNEIEDITTYIDPAKYNFIFAETSLDSQNFWVQIAIDMEVRRKMSARLMPNL